MQNNFSFGKRYLVVGTIIFILSVFSALNISVVGIKPSIFFTYTSIFSGGLFIISLILYVIFRKNSFLSSTFLNCFVVTLIFIIGFSRTFYVASNFHSNENTLSNSSSLYGRIISEPELSSSGKSYSVYADIYETKSSGDDASFKKPVKTILYFPVNSSYPSGYGETFECSLRFPISSKPAYKGAFNFNRYLKQKNVCASLYCSDYIKTDVRYPTSFIDKFMNFGIKLRSLISAFCDTSAYSSDEKALLKGIMLGDKTDMSESLYKSYTDSGLAHITAVSGMHTSYLFLAISFVLAFLKIPRKVYPFAAIPILLLFGAVALFTPSVSRAVIMLSTLLLAPLFFRKNDSLTALAISAVIVLFINPYNLESYSMILSYSATAGILLFAQPISKLFAPALSATRRSKIPKAYHLVFYIINSIALSASGIIGTAYFTARFFGRIPLAGLIANIFITPLVAISFIGGYINSIIYYVFSPAANLISRAVLKPALFLTNSIARLFENPVFSLSVPRPSPFFFIVYLVIIYCIYILLTNNKNPPA